MNDADVIIIGAGPVGLALAIELGTRSISCLVIEKNERVGFAPRAKTTNVRTRTHLRRWGIAELLAEASPFGVGYPSDVHFVTKLSGHSLARIENAFNCAPARSELYPEHAQWIPQYKLEQILRAHAETLSTVRMAFSTEFEAARHYSDGVGVALRDLSSGHKVELSCRYLVGADGARSAVRSAIGAKMQGQYGLSRNYNIVFRAPGLSAAHPHGSGIMYWQINPVAPGLIGPMDENDVWFFMPTRLPEGLNISDEDARALISKATGIDLPYEILSRDEWTASQLIADRYRDGRIFLAGDACHLHPPFGGYGMNMGVSDSVDLGWKLAAVLHGWGGAGLLESYEAERKPIHEQVIAEAVANHSILANDLWSEGLENEGPEADDLRIQVGERIIDQKTREFRTLRTVLGYCYRGSPVILDGDEANSTSEGASYEPSSRAGCLAPHAWLADGSSLYDSFGSGLTLITGTRADETDILKLEREACERNIPLKRVPSPDARLYDRAYTLVRPDQHVAWRGNDFPDDLLMRVTGW